MRNHSYPFKKGGKRWLRADGEDGCGMVAEWLRAHFSMVAGWLRKSCALDNLMVAGMVADRFSMVADGCGPFSPVKGAFFDIGPDASLC